MLHLDFPLPQWGIRELASTCIYHASSGTPNLPSDSYQNAFLTAITILKIIKPKLNINILPRSATPKGAD
jgi:hypothetical protein